MQELKQCPFCHDGGELEVYSTRICEGWYTASVLCNQCGVQMIRGGDTEQEAKDYVIQAWNNRYNEGVENAPSMHENDGKECEIKQGTSKSAYSMLINFDCDCHCLECGPITRSKCPIFKRWLSK